MDEGGALDALDRSAGEEDPPTPLHPHLFLLPPLSPPARRSSRRMGGRGVTGLRPLSLPRYSTAGRRSPSSSPASSSPPAAAAAPVIAGRRRSISRPLSLPLPVYCSTREKVKRKGGERRKPLRESNCTDFNSSGVILSYPVLWLRVTY